ncbi:putative dCMP deaminase [Bacillus phage vB_BspM_Internexus]|nr:putative dCMP deaminase [Bacillus phage vB_BspM_Internexus]
MTNKWDLMYMDIAKRVAIESKCAAKQVGCIIEKDTNILAVGINGTASGKENCCDKFMKRDGKWYKKHSTLGKGMKNIFDPWGWELCEDQEEHHKWSLIHEIHAEMNAIAKAHKNGVSIEGATAYITYSPCFNCAKQLITHGIKHIVFDKEYDGFNETLKLLENHDVEVININNKGE